MHQPIRAHGRERREGTARAADLGRAAAVRNCIAQILVVRRVRGRARVRALLRDGVGCGPVGQIQQGVAGVEGREVVPAAELFCFKVSV